MFFQACLIFIKYKYSKIFISQTTSVCTLLKPTKFLCKSLGYHPYFKKLYIKYITNKQKTAFLACKRAWVSTPAPEKRHLMRQWLQFLMVKMADCFFERSVIFIKEECALVCKRSQTLE